MFTLDYIKKLLDEYIQAVSSIDVKTEHEYNYRFNAIRDHFKNLFNAMRDASPELLQYNFPSNMEGEEAQRIIDLSVELSDEELRRKKERSRFIIIILIVLFLLLISITLNIISFIN